MYVDLIGYAAGGLLAICYVPQVVQTFTTKKADDVSFWMIFLTLLSAVLYEIYAAMLGLWPVVIMNGIFGVLVTIQLGLKIRFSRSPAVSMSIPSRTSASLSGSMPVSGSSSITIGVSRTIARAIAMRCR